MTAGLSLRTSQQLALTPQLQQAIRLLQLSTLELSGEVEQMLLDNPFLEREEDGASDTPSPATEDAADTRSAVGEDSGPELDFANDTGTHDAEQALDMSAEDSPWSSEGPALSSGASGASDDEDEAPETWQVAHESLHDHLHRQTLELRLSPEDSAALRFLIESLDDDGYLQDSLAQLAATLITDDDDLDTLQELVHRFTLALHLLQSMEPVGVGARNLAECLSLQLKTQRRVLPASSQESADTLAQAQTLLSHPEALELLARSDLPRMAELIGADEEAARAVQASIGSLEPRPGRRFVQVEQHLLVPDVIVSLDSSTQPPRLQVQINSEVMPRLRVHELYAGALRGARASEGHAALSQRLQEARWFVRNIQQRFDTILRVSRAIVQHQRAFFTHGEVAMRPLVQRELAEELDLHESTISRVTTAKYMATPRGTFELKYFFGSALGSESGGGTSSIAVRALIREIVAAEDPQAPWSDARISELLKEQGIACARRTVAKYREALRIPVASQRKQSTR